MFSRQSLVIFISSLLLAPQLRAGTEVEPPPNAVIISVREQKLALVQNGQKIATYPVSTSKFGLGDGWGRMTTPLGVLQVAQKIGDHAVQGAVFHNRRYTGEVLPPNAPGRDPIVTRIIHLRGLEPWNANAYARGIYIHGTPEERTIGRPASYGCIRMKSSDVTALYNQLPIGATVQIVQDGFPQFPVAAIQPARETFTASRGKSGLEKNLTTKATRVSKGSASAKTAAPLLASSGRGA